MNTSMKMGFEESVRLDQVLYIYLIVPAESDIAGTCGIFTKEASLIKRGKDHALKDYRSDPYSWKHVGHMNSQGRLITLELPTYVRSANTVGLEASLWDEIRSCEPLMAGTVFEFFHKFLFWSEDDYRRLHEL